MSFSLLAGDKLQKDEGRKLSFVHDRCPVCLYITLQTIRAFGEFPELHEVRVCEQCDTIQSVSKL